MNLGGFRNSVESGARATWEFAKKAPGEVAKFATETLPTKAQELWGKLGDGIEKIGKSTAVEHIKDAGDTAGRILNIVVDEGRNNFADEGLAKLVPAAQVLSRVARGAIGVRDNGFVDRGIGAVETGLAVAANWKDHKAIALATLTAAFVPRIFRFGMRAGDIAAALRAVSDMNGFVRGVFGRKNEFKKPVAVPATPISTTP